MPMSGDLASVSVAPRGPPMSNQARLQRWCSVGVWHIHATCTYKLWLFGWGTSAHSICSCEAPRSPKE